MEINDHLINKAAHVGDLLLVKYYKKVRFLPQEIIVSSAVSGNIDLVKFIIEQEGIDINAKNKIYFYNLIFKNNI